MNDMTPEETGTELALPAQTDMIGLFKTENALDPIISKLEEAARSQAATYDASTAKGRKALRSLANTVSSKKAELDKQGKSLTDAQRKEIAAVNAGRKLAEERLAALRDEIKKPAEDWDAAEDARVAKHRHALDCFDLNRADANSTADQVRHVLADVEAVTAGPDWEEFQPIAEAKREDALTHYRGLLASAEQRERDAVELAHLRAKAEERTRRDAEEAAAKAEAERLAQEQAEAERRTAEKAEADRIAAEQAEVRRIEAERLEAERREQAERDRAEAAEQARIEAQEAAKKAAAEAEARHTREIAEAKAREDAAAQRERDRIAEEQRKADEARARREADQAHRARIRNEIADGLKTLEAGNWFALADALIDGKVPHTQVTL